VKEKDEHRGTEDTEVTEKGLGNVFGKIRGFVSSANIDSERKKAMDKKSFDLLTEKIIGAAIEVHKQLGCGLLESVYAHCMVKELRSRGMIVYQEVPLAVHYKGELLEKEFYIDLLIEDAIILELKAVETVIPLHKAQLLSLLRLSGKRVGLLINFNVPTLKEGIHRVVNGWV
jgi:GxxExxY protein